jgi:hypothetical protein
VPARFHPDKILANPMSVSRPACEIRGETSLRV